MPSRRNEEWKAGASAESSDVPRCDRPVSDWSVRFALRGYAVVGSDRSLAQLLQLNLTRRHAGENCRARQVEYRRTVDIEEPGLPEGRIDAAGNTTGSVSSVGEIQIDCAD